MNFQGQHVYLRPLELNDVNGNYPNWFNDEDVCKYNSHSGMGYTKEMALSYINSIQNNSTIEVFAICDINTDKHIGNISLQQISSKNQNAEFAILIGEKSFWGKGLSKEASELLFKYGFEVLKLHRIHCGTSEANIPMQNLALSLGMELEGKRKDAMFKNDTFFDILEYGIIVA